MKMSVNGYDNVQPELIKVYVRQRPFTRTELELRRKTVVQEMSSTVIRLRSGNIEKEYKFDRVFDHNAHQQEVYDEVVSPLVELVLSGYTCTVFAYGQTGTGKTFTMVGDVSSDFANDSLSGMMPRAAAQIFSELDNRRSVYAVTVSFVEIYNEEIRDLLVPDGCPLRIYEDPDHKGSSCIKGVSERIVKNVDELNNLLILGTLERQTASTNLNRHSSRSHTLFTIVVNTQELTEAGEEIVKTGKIYLVDLAGSENIGKSGAIDMRAREAGVINKSLLTLGKVIKALAMKKPHVPYRESKLTRILQDSLGGTSKTCMIATFAATLDAFDETVSTLDYAHVAKNVATCPKMNINKKKTNALKDSKEEVVRLRQELNAARQGEGFYIPADSYEKMNDNIKLQSERILILMQELGSLEDHLNSKQLYYEQLDKSFQQTRATVTSISEDLEKETAKRKLNQFKIKHLHEKYVKLLKTASTLYNVCQTVIKNEEIYFDKHEKQCEIIPFTANIGKNALLIASDCAREIPNLAENFQMKQKSHLENIETNAAVLKDNKDKNLKSLHQLLEETRPKGNLFTPFKRDGLNSRFNALNSNVQQLKTEELQEITKSVDDVRDYLVKRSKDVQEKRTKFRGEVEQESARIKQHQDNTYKLLQTLYENTEDRLHHVKERLDQNNKQKDLFLELRKTSIAKQQQIGEELKALDETELIIKELMPTENESSSLKNMEEAFYTFNDFPEATKILCSLITDLLNKIAYEESKCKQKSLERHYAFADELHERYQEIDNILNNWTERFTIIEKSVNKITDEHMKHIGCKFECIKTCETTYNNELKQFIQKSCDDLHHLEKNLTVSVHDGNTPIKREHKYPKDIGSPVSEEVLHKLFKENQ